MAHLSSNNQALSDENFSEIAAIARSRFGLSLTLSKRPLVTARLQKRLEALNFESFDRYLDHIKSSDGAGETNDLVASLTTNVTHFFREMHHFELLRERIFPDLIERARNGEKVRIWCAGCSSGQEPFSLAMTLLPMFPDVSKHDFRILATDIDATILEKARQGFYPASEIKGLDDAQKKQFFHKVSDGYQIRNELIGLITFGLLNLVEPFPFKGPFDVVICRNVAIYFDRRTQEEIWTKFADIMPDGAILMIGHSERLSTLAENDFDAIGVTSYRRRKD
jgi:chemotaxis protein methyltransferase CheR